MIEQNHFEIAVDHADALVHVFERVLQLRRLQGEFLFLPFQFGDVGPEGDCAAILRAVLGVPEPPAIGQFLVYILCRLVVLANTFGDPLLLAPLGAFDEPSFGPGPDQVLERHARYHQIGDLGEQIDVFLIESHQTVIGIKIREGSIHILDSVRKPSFGSQCTFHRFHLG